MSNGLVHWTCPQCSHENTDDYFQTSFPLCSNCDVTIYWEDILTEDEQSRLNELFVAWKIQEEDDGIEPTGSA